MKTFVVKMKDGQELRIRANHVFDGNQFIELVEFDEVARDNRAVAVFNPNDVLMIYREDLSVQPKSD